MNKIVRKMTKVEHSEEAENSVCVNPFMRSQASFNSDGCLTLRNYDATDRDTDEIIIFNRQETKAILDLFKFFKNNELPF